VTFGDSRLPVRFWRKVKLGVCWIWIGGRTRQGYGLFWVAGRMRAAHRFLYETLFGTVPSALELDHLCRNPRGVNPHHLEAVSHVDNMRRGAWAMKTACPVGHPYDADNTYLRNGNRKCKICKNESSKIAKRRARAEKRYA